MNNLLRISMSILASAFLFNNAQAQEYASTTNSLQEGKAPGLTVKLLSKTTDTKTYLLVFKKGDEIVAGLTEFVNKHKIKSAYYTGLGDALSSKAGWFDYDKKQFKVIPIGVSEVTSFTGDVSWYNNEAIAHTHYSAALDDGTVKGGHLLELFCGPTMEIILVEQPVTLYKKLDPEFNAALIDTDK